MQIYGQVENAQLEILSSAPASPQKARIYFDSTLGIARYYSGTAWISLSSASSSFGPGINWNNPSGGPLETKDGDNELVYKFKAAVTQTLIYNLPVPQGYTAGGQISIVVGFYSPSTSGTVLFQTTSTLVRSNTDSKLSTSNSYNSTNVALTNTVANQFRTTTLDITNSSGLINSISVSAGDLIKVALTRGTDTDTADVIFLPKFTVPKLS